MNKEEMHKVLIAEDNSTFMRILKAGLKNYEDRFEIITAKDGEKAIEVLKKQPISLLVTDLQMPKVDGLALLAHVNQNYPEMPCIVMTAHGTPQIEEKLRQDVLHYIEKPFKPKDLARVIIPALETDIPDGSLKGISIVSFLQIIKMEEKTCLLEIDAPDKQKGLLYFYEGDLFDAIYGDLKGADAALKMIPLEKVKMRFKNLPKRKVARRIEIELMALIMEAMRIKDETSVE